jgi:hypothetical protein
MLYQDSMFFLPHLRNHGAKVCALAATILILPVLAYANPNGTNQNVNPQNTPNQNHNPQNPK